MDHVLSTHLFVNHRLTSVWLDRVWDAGVPAVEIFCARQHLDYRNKAQVNELGAWFRDAELKPWALHSPMFTDEVWGRTGPQSEVAITERVKAKRIQAVDEIKRALEAAEAIPVRYLVQHLGAPTEEFSEHALEAAFSSLDELNLFAKQRGVEILLENIPNGLSNAERLNYFLGITHLSNGYCFDVGHAHLYAVQHGTTIESEFELMKTRIRSTHVHGNDGMKDTHRFPFLHADDKIDWAGVMNAFRTRPGQFPLNLELREHEEIPRPFDGAREVFERLENVA